MIEEDKNIDRLTTVFFEIFTNKYKVADLERIYDLLIPEALIINNTKKEHPEVYNIKSFIEPRAKILSDGTLIDFEEKETSCKTEVSGSIAQRISSYIKSGKSNGEYFEIEGSKIFQFIKIKNNWKIASVIWCDKVC